MNRFLIIPAIFALYLCSCGGQGPVSDSFYAMGTYISITIYEPAGKDITVRIKDRLTELERIFSDYQEGAWVQGLNQNRSASPVPPELISVLGTVRSVDRILPGRFDVTLGSVSALYGFKNLPVPDTFPSPVVLAERLAECGMNRIVIDSAAIALTGTSRLDFGGCLKGLALDEIKRILTGNRIQHYLVDFGGNLLVGMPKNKPHFTIGVVNPRQPDQVQMTITCADQFISTSGDYQNYVTIAGTCQVHHIIDPQTGRPANNGVRSVTVLSTNGISGDILSTAFFISGVNATAAVLPKFPEVSRVIFITGNGDEENRVIELSNEPVMN